MREWHPAKSKFAVSIARTDGITMAAAIAKELQQLISDCDKLIANILKTNHLIEVKSNGWVSDEDLLECKKMRRSI